MAGAYVQSGAQRRMRAVVPREAKILDCPLTLDEGFGNRLGAVGRTVVNQNELHVIAVSAQPIGDGEDARRQLGKIRFLVVERRHNAEQLGHGRHELKAEGAFSVPSLPAFFRTPAWSHGCHSEIRTVSGALTPACRSRRSCLRIILYFVKGEPSSPSVAAKPPSRSNRGV